ncbi:MAG: type II toxin-antitoxin system Phd/YefM family antitoxin [Planctomycetota bacterium]
MRELAVTELRTTLGAVLDQVGDGHGVMVTRDGEPAAAIVPPDVAAWGLAIANRFAGRLPPFTQAALDRWAEGVLTSTDLAEVMEAEHG